MGLRNCCATKLQLSAAGILLNSLPCVRAWGQVGLCRCRHHDCRVVVARACHFSCTFLVGDQYLGNQYVENSGCSQPPCKLLCQLLPWVLHGPALQCGCKVQSHGVLRTCGDCCTPIQHSTICCCRTQSCKVSAQWCSTSFTSAALRQTPRWRCAWTARGWGGQTSGDMGSVLV